MTEADRPTDGSKRVISQPGPCVDLHHWGESRGSLATLGPFNSQQQGGGGKQGAAALSLSGARQKFLA